MTQVYPSYTHPIFFSSSSEGYSDWSFQMSDFTNTPASCDTDVSSFRLDQAFFFRALSCNSSKTNLSVGRHHICPYDIATCQGACQGAQPYDSHEPVTAVYKSPWATTPGGHRKPPTSPRYSPIESTHISQSILSPSLNREQLLKRFFTLHFGDIVVPTESFLGTFLAKGAQRPRGPTILAAVDTLCLVEIGIAFHDQQVISEARQRHHATLANLQTDLVGSAAYDESVLETIFVLGILSAYPQLTNESRQMHLQALQSLMLAQGANRTFSKFGQMLLLTLQNLMAIFGYMLRRDLRRLTSPAWTKHLPILDPLREEWHRINYQVPALLERTDKLLAEHAPSEHRILATLSHLTILEGAMQRWLTEWYLSFEDMPYHAVPVQESTFLARFMSSAEHAHLAPLVTKALVFPSMLHADVHAGSWTTLLTVKTSLLELSGVSRFATSLEQARRWRSEADDLARQLCQSVMYTLRPGHGTRANYCASSLVFHAAVWYAKSKDYAMLEWCTQVWHVLQQGGFGDFYLEKPFEECMAVFLAQETIPS